MGTQEILLTLPKRRLDMHSQKPLLKYHKLERLILRKLFMFGLLEMQVCMLIKA
jgi:hypothetical protein